MNKNLIRILFVEDHKPLLENLAEFFSGSRYQCDFASNGLTALHLLGDNRYDVVVLDILLPGIDGIRLLERIRKDLDSAVPVILLTALDSLTNKEEGFGAGADDYLCKPFALRELELRIRALVKRGEHVRKKISIGELYFDPETLTLSGEGKQLTVSGFSGDILAMLLQAWPRHVSYREMSERLWGEDAVDENTIRTHVYTLRKLLKQAFGKSMVKSVFGKGYQFSPEQE